MAAVLWMRAGGATARLVALEAPLVAVGRSAGNDLVLDGDEQVSRRHAVLVEVAGGWCVRDLSSHNGTFVNGHRITGDRPLRSGDEVRIGIHRMVLHEEETAADPQTVQPDPVPELTRREREVLLALVRPLSMAGVFTTPATTREIAAALVVTDAAVKLHLASLYRKFAIGAATGEPRRLLLANEAIRRGAVLLADVRARPR